MAFGSFFSNRTQQLINCFIMAIYNTDTRLSDVILKHPSLIPVIDRLGVSLGVGDRTIGEVCEKCGIDKGFFLSMVNTFIDEEYFPVNPRDTFTLAKTIDYLEKTDAYYLKSQLPNIERHFSSLISRSGKDNNLELLMTFYGEASQELRECMSYDADVLYPTLRKGVVPPEYTERDSAYNDVGEKLHDLLYLIVAHLKGTYDHNLCMAVISAVFSLERDIRQNNRIRQRILKPSVLEMCGNKA